MIVLARYVFKWDWKMPLTEETRLEAGRAPLADLMCAPPFLPNA
jgi:hypothetical protein